MSQYTILSPTTTSSIELTDGTSTFRVNVRNLGLYFDQAYTELGFDGVEGTDWNNISESTLGAGKSTFRIGARDAAWTIDQAITDLGMSGNEGVDWDQVESHRL